MTKKPLSLVTGGAGFLGSHLTETLLKLGHKVIVIDNLSGGFKRNIVTGAIFSEGSINDEYFLESVFKKYRFDYTFHLAAYAAENLSHYLRKYNYENNLIGSVNLVNRAIRYKIKHFVFISSIAVYGKNQLPMKEDLTPNPDNPYGIAKLAVEYDLKIANKQFGLRYTIFRPHNVYGERQNIVDPDRNVVGIFIRQALNNKPLPIFGSGWQKRSFTYVNDVVPYIAKSISLPQAFNQTFNIGADKPYTVNQLARLISQIVAVPLEIHYLPKRNEVSYAFANHQKAKSIFGINKMTNLKDGLNKTIAWVKTNVKLTSAKKLKLELV